MFCEELCSSNPDVDSNTCVIKSIHLNLSCILDSLAFSDFSSPNSKEMKPIMLPLPPLYSSYEYFSNETLLSLPNLHIFLKSELEYVVLGVKEPLFYWLPFGVGTICQRFTLDAKPFQIN